MTRDIPHPASTLPEQQRIDYLNVIATMALIDGRTDPAELRKLKRLAEVLKIPTPAADKVLGAIRLGKHAQPVEKDTIKAFREDDELRSSLMMDSIVIAFSDGQLAKKEFKQLARLAAALELADEDVVHTARFVEEVLFKRLGKDEQTLAREFGQMLAGERGRHSGFHWIRDVGTAKE